MSGKIDLRQVFTDSEIAQALHSILIASGVLHTCTNCRHWHDMGAVPPHSEACTKFDQRPPATVIVEGCGHWEQDIPF